MNRVPGADDLASPAPGAHPITDFEYRERGVGTRVRKDPASVSACVGVHADVEIRLVLQSGDAEGAQIHFGHDGPELIVDFADADSLERLAIAAATGARQLRQRMATLYPSSAQPAENAELADAGGHAVVPLGRDVTHAVSTRPAEPTPKLTGVAS